MSDGFRELFVTAPDGLKLYARDYGPQDGALLPVVCLAGLARHSADFDTLARALSGGVKARRVVAPDYRGRGRSGYDSNPGNYTLAVELTDTLAVLEALKIARAVFVGTSRGGLLTMLLASARPDLIAGAVLNDIGPVIEPSGLRRIKGYVGKLPQPKDYEEAAAILRGVFGAQFPKLSAGEWLAFAQRVFERKDGRLAPTYDVALSAGLEAVDFDKPLPALWKEFDALAAAPLMIIRGANSDLLSRETIADMRRHREQSNAEAPDIVEVPDQGHAPLLADAPTIAAIANFVARCGR